MPSLPWHLALVLNSSHCQEMLPGATPPPHVVICLCFLPTCPPTACASRSFTTLTAQSPSLLKPPFPDQTQKMFFFNISFGVLVSQLCFQLTSEPCHILLFLSWREAATMGRSPWGPPRSNFRICILGPEIAQLTQGHNGIFWLAPKNSTGKKYFSILGTYGKLTKNSPSPIERVKK